MVYYVDGKSGGEVCCWRGMRRGLRSVSFETSNRAEVVRDDWVKDEAALEEVVRQLQEYFAGELREFDLELAAGGGRSFSCGCGRALRGDSLRGGRFLTGELAKRVGKCKGLRGRWGLANGAIRLR